MNVNLKSFANFNNMSFKQQTTQQAKQDSSPIATISERIKLIPMDADLHLCKCPKTVFKVVQRQQVLGLEPRWINTDNALSK